MGSQIGGLIGGIWGDPGQNFVDLQGGPDAVFGTKPDIAPFTPTDLAAEQLKALQANIGSVDEIDKLLNALIPGYTDMLAQGTSNAQSLLKGELPADVQSQVLRSSAFKSLMGGFSGTPMSHALGARDIGRTSLDMMTLGNNSAQLWDSIAMGNAAPLMISPMGQAGITQANNAGDQATKQFGFNVKAAPDPGAAGIFNVDAALGSQMLSLGMGAAMGAGGGGSQAPVATSTNWNTYGGGSGATAPDWRTSATGGAPTYNTQGWGWSDSRRKENLILVGQSQSGIEIYEFNYKGFEGAASIRFRGAIAEQVLLTNPAAVRRGADGFLEVNYDAIDVMMEMVNA